MAFVLLSGLLLGITWIQTRAELSSSVPTFVLMTLGCVLVYGALGFAKTRPKTKIRLAITTLIALLGSALLSTGYVKWRAELRLQDALPRHLEGRDLRINGCIDALPQRLSDTPRLGWRFTFQTEQLPFSDGAPIPSRLLLNWYIEAPQHVAVPAHDEASDTEMSPTVSNLLPGQCWQLSVRLKAAHGLSNPGGFDYEGWLFEHALPATGYVRRTQEAPRYLGDNLTGSMRIERWRANLRQRLFQAVPPTLFASAGILSGLTLGDQQAISASQWALFNQSGLTHLMVVSGSHITLVAALMAWLSHRCLSRFPRLCLCMPAPKVATLIAFATAVFYTALSGSGLPALRALIMLAITTLCQLSHRRIHWSTTLGWSLAAVLLWDPWAVLAAGFWLSFGTVAAILLISQVSASQHWTQHLREWLRIQWAATVATLPLLFAFFQQWSWCSPLANLIAIPLIGILITPLALLGLSLLCLPGLGYELGAGLLSALAWLLDGCLDGLAFILARVTDVFWHLPSPTPLALCAALLGVILLLLPPGWPGRWRIGLIAFAPMLLTKPPHPEAGTWWADVLDVGQGQAILIRTAQHTLMYDSGPRYGPPPQGSSSAPPPSAAQRVLLPYLQHVGIHRLDRLLVSHRDSDHAGGTEALLQALTVNSVYSPGIHPHDTPCIAGQSWVWDGIRFEILHPPTGLTAQLQPRQSNESSCVLHIRHESDSSAPSLLITGDLPDTWESRLVESWGEALHSDVLIAPHHGSRHSSSDALLQATGAHWVMVSAGYLNRFAHPHPEVLERYQQHGLAVHRTDWEGRLAIRPSEKDGTTANRLQITAWRTEAKRYWHWQPAHPYQAGR